MRALNFYRKRSVFIAKYKTRIEISQIFEFFYRKCPKISKFLSKLRYFRTSKHAKNLSQNAKFRQNIANSKILYRNCCKITAIFIASMSILSQGVEKNGDNILSPFLFFKK